MQGLILAAGMGRRLKALTSDNTKCMVKVNGRTLIERMLGQLDCLGLSRIVIVVGYEGQKLIDYIATLPVRTPLVYVNNPIYDRTNNIYSLYLAREHLVQEDTLLLESDLIFEDSVLRVLLDDPRDTLALVDKYESWMDGTVVTLSDDDVIVDFVPGKHIDFRQTNTYYKTVNIYKFSQAFSATHYVPFLEAYCAALGNNEYYEQVLRVIATLDEPGIRAKRLDGPVWYEIDDIQDLDIAASLFPANREDFHALQERYGGYWRYPKMLDFCYLVNPYFPSPRLVAEMQANFYSLLTQYPSGLRVNTLLTAKFTDLPQDYVLVGNGAAELIKEIMNSFAGRVGFIRPTFEEYPNRFDSARSVVFQPAAPDFAYTAEDLIAFFEGQDLEALVLINPDNPTGHYLSCAQRERLLTWTRERGIVLVWDESFSDFADEPDNTLLDCTVLEANPQLLVVKSISKSYGVPGLRLGFAACSDTQRLAGPRARLPIWNINSFAEFYLQIAGKYESDYAAALVLFRAERQRYLTRLAALPGLRLLPTQANYVMAELTGGWTSHALTSRLLHDYRLFIKDLTPKFTDRAHQYIRLAVRTTEDNDRLIEALQYLLTETP